jgi:ketosteroid isomerase-like protein
MRTFISGVIIGSLVVGFASSAYTRNSNVTNVWNPAAAQEAEMAMHKLHGAWDKMDMAAVEKAIADDGFLATFEYTDTNEAITLRNKAELVAWLRKGFDDLKARNATTVAIPQSKMDCRATDTLAVCTEECDIIYKRADGMLEVSPHRGTSVMRKGPQGWQFTHWHVSEAGARKTVTAADYKIKDVH